MAAGDKKRALVTGAAGFIGAHVVRSLRALGRCEVIALDDLSGGSRDNLPPDVEFVQGSIEDERLVGSLFEKRIDYVYHLAAYAAEGLSHFIRTFNYRNNLLGSMNLLNHAVRHEVECFVFTSSIAVYGSARPPLREDMAPVPEDPYGIAKYAVELDLRAAHEMFGLDNVIFRPHNVYGEYQNLGDPYRNVIGIFMNQIMRGEPMSIFGDGEQVRAFTYVGDIASVIAGSPWVAGARNEVFNVGAERPYTVNELAREVARAMGKPEHPVKHLDPRKESVSSYSDHAKADRVFGKGASTPLRDGLEKMAAWAWKTGARSGKPFEGVEVAKNLPPSWKKLLKS